MVLYQLSVPGVQLIWIVGQGPPALAAGAGGVCLDNFLSSVNSLIYLHLWETARYIASKGR